MAWQSSLWERREGVKPETRVQPTANPAVPLQLFHTVCLGSGAGRGTRCVAIPLLVCESSHWLYLRGTRMTFRSLDTS